MGYERSEKKSWNFTDRNFSDKCLTIYTVSQIGAHNTNPVKSRSLESRREISLLKVPYFWKISAS